MPEQAEPTWATALERLADLLGGRSEQFRSEAEEWLRQSVTACWKRDSLHDLTRSERGVAFRRFLAVVDELAGEGEIAFALDQRLLVARAFARHFCTEPVPGPEWRVSPAETARFTWLELVDDTLPI